MDDIINLIVNQNLLLIHRIINHNLLLTTNVNSTIRIEKHNKLVTKMIRIETKWGNMAIFKVEYLHLTKKLPIIPLGINSYEKKKNPTDSYFTSLIIEASRMH